MRERVGRSGQTSILTGPRLRSQGEPGAGREGGEATAWAVLFDTRIKSSHLDACRAILWVPGGGESQGVGRKPGVLGPRAERHTSKRGSYPRLLLQGRRKPADGRVSPIPYPPGHRATLFPSTAALRPHTDLSQGGQQGLCDCPFQSLMDLGHWILRITPFHLQILIFVLKWSEVVEAALTEHGRLGSLQTTDVSRLQSGSWMWEFKVPACRVLVRTLPTAGDARHRALRRQRGAARSLRA